MCWHFAVPSGVGDPITYILPASISLRTGVFLSFPLGCELSEIICWNDFLCTKCVVFHSFLIQIQSCFWTHVDKDHSNAYV